MSINCLATKPLSRTIRLLNAELLPPFAECETTQRPCALTLTATLMIGKSARPTLPKLCYLVPPRRTCNSRCGGTGRLARGLTDACHCDAVEQIVGRERRERVS